MRERERPGMDGLTNEIQYQTGQVQLRWGFRGAGGVHSGKSGGAGKTHMLVFGSFSVFTHSFPVTVTLGN